MDEPTNPEARALGNAGLLDHLSALASALAGYLHARLQLAGIESKEAFGHYLKLLILLAAGLVVLVFGYIFLCIGFVFAIALLLSVNWIWVMLGFGLAHVIVALICGLMAKAKLAAPMFTATINEFKNDQSWLKSSAKQN